MKILQLSVEDIPDIIALDKAAFPDYDLPAITEEEIKATLRKGFMLGFKQDGKLLSNIHVKEESDSYYIAGIATLPEKQGLGFADLLLKEVISIAKKNSIRQITATIRPGNVKSLNLFFKNGFEKSKFLKDYYGKGKDRVLVVYLNRS